MAKPKYSIIVDSFDQLVAIERFLNPAAAGAVATPSVVAAPPPPPAVAAPPPPVTGGITVEQVVAKMAEKVSKPGAAAAVSALMAQYNAKEPGKPGPITNVDPIQFQNLLNALDAL